MNGGGALRLIFVDATLGLKLREHTSPIFLVDFQAPSFVLPHCYEL